jgi:hypothetical protein
MSHRARALQAFYEGPVWRRHREAANATVIDSDNVLLLRPASSTSGFVLRRERPAPGSMTILAVLVVATIYYPGASAAAGFPAFCQSAVAPALTEAGAAPLAVLVTEDAPNNFPRLPVREGEQVLVSFTAFASQ